MIWLGCDDVKWGINLLNEYEGDDLVWKGDIGE